MQTRQLTDIETVAQDVMAAEEWNSSHYEQALRLAEQIINTPDDQFETTGGVLRDLPLPLRGWQAKRVRISINRPS